MEHCIFDEIRWYNTLCNPSVTHCLTHLLKSILTRRRQSFTYYTKTKMVIYSATTNGVLAIFFRISRLKGKLI